MFNFVDITKDVLIFLQILRLKFWNFLFNNDLIEFRENFNGFSPVQSQSNQFSISQFYWRKFHETFQKFRTNFRVS